MAKKVRAADRPIRLKSTGDKIYLVADRAAGDLLTAAGMFRQTDRQPEDSSNPSNGSFRLLRGEPILRDDIVHSPKNPARVEDGPTTLDCFLLPGLN
ncbi:MAG TPA: hypothetical protein PKB03_00440 [Baekduia sp.]|nr:hypothetical protein [Baekduia sp.]